MSKTVIITRFKSWFPREHGLATSPRFRPPLAPEQNVYRQIFTGLMSFCHPTNSVKPLKQTKHWPQPKVQPHPYFTKSYILNITCHLANVHASDLSLCFITVHVINAFNDWLIDHPPPSPAGRRALIPLYWLWHQYQSNMNHRWRQKQ